MIIYRKVAGKVKVLGKDTGPVKSSVTQFRRSNKYFVLFLLSDLNGVVSLDHI